MEYTGKLYGRVGGVYFDTSHTSEDWDNLIKENNDLKKQLDKLSESSVKTCCVFGCNNKADKGTLCNKHYLDK